MTDNKSFFHSSLAVSNIRNHISITLEMDNTNNNVGSRLDITRILKKKLVAVVLGPVRDSLSVRVRRPLALTAETLFLGPRLRFRCDEHPPFVVHAPSPISDGREGGVLENTQVPQRLPQSLEIVESVREGANDMKEGNLVVPIFNGECGDCKYCKCEKTNMCERFGVDPMRKVMVPQEYTVVDSACVVKIRVDGDGDLNPYIKRLTLLNCGVSTARTGHSTRQLRSCSSRIGGGEALRGSETLATSQKPRRQSRSDCEVWPVPVLILLLRCSDSWTQEHAVTALLNLSLHEDNKMSTTNAGAVKSLIYVLKTGTETLKQNAACALLSLALVEENKGSIGAFDAIPPLVSFLLNGLSRGEKDVLTTLYKLCFVRHNKEKAVKAME
ncbi:hypothetical protein JHK86_006465 [Glycine max]|nr:hypothetical protein JHK86_006465 [Glycine max]